MSSRALSRRALGTLLLGGAAVALPALLGGCAVHGAPRASPDGLPRGDPREHGVDAAAILTYLDDVSAAGFELHSFMLWRQGHVVAEGWWWPYAPQRPHIMHSLTKSVTASAVGLAMAEGHFSLDDRVVSFFPQELPGRVDDKLAAMRVRDLLTMQTGHAQGVSSSVWRQIKTSWTAEFFKLPVVHEPGTTFVYNSAASYMLAAILTRTTGLGLRKYLEPRFFRPLRIGTPHWDISPEGINPGANGLSWQTADSLKLGILHLREGRWGERQVLPADWVREATRPQAANGRYGYQWWMGPKGAYFAAGSFGQYAIVFPAHDAVLALTAAIPENTDFSARTWKHFPAAFDGGSSSSVSVSAAGLRSRLHTLRVLPPLTATESSQAARISRRLFTMQPNDDAVTSVQFDFESSRCNFTLRDRRGAHHIAVGLRDWIEGTTTMSGAPLHHQYEPNHLRVVAGGRWLDEHTFEMTWQFVETAFRDRVVCRFEGDAIAVERSVNVNSAATTRPTIHGSLSTSRV
jgi:CubicO group peptidase (beta-lactamase class C family)